MLKFILVLFLLFPLTAKAANFDEYGLKKIGEARLSMLFWDIYDIELYAENGAVNEKDALALAITYMVEIEGADIADRSAQEMRKQGSATEVQLATWHTQMKEIFPDVSEGTKLVGVKNPTGEAVFYHDGKRVGTVKDPDFTDAFFDIWLSEKTSEPELREQLLAGNYAKE